MYRFQFGDVFIHSKYRLVIFFYCFRYLKRIVTDGNVIHISKY